MGLRREVFFGNRFAPLGGSKEISQVTRPQCRGETTGPVGASRERSSVDRPPAPNRRPETTTEGPGTGTNKFIVYPDSVRDRQGPPPDPPWSSDPTPRDPRVEAAQPAPRWTAVGGNEGPRTSGVPPTLQNLACNRASPEQGSVVHPPFGHGVPTIPRRPLGRGEGNANQADSRPHVRQRSPPETNAPPGVKRVNVRNNDNLHNQPPPMPAKELEPDHPQWVEALGTFFLNSEEARLMSGLTHDLVQESANRLRLWIPWPAQASSNQQRAWGRAVPHQLVKEGLTIHTATPHRQGLMVAVTDNTPTVHRLLSRGLKLPDETRLDVLLPGVFAAQLAGQRLALGPAHVNGIPINLPKEGIEVVAKSLGHPQTVDREKVHKDNPPTGRWIVTFRGPPKAQFLPPDWTTEDGLVIPIQLFRGPWRRCHRCFGLGTCQCQPNDKGQKWGVTKPGHPDRDGTRKRQRPQGPKPKPSVNWDPEEPLAVLDTVVQAQHSSERTTIPQWWKKVVYRRAMDLDHLQDLPQCSDLEMKPIPHGTSAQDGLDDSQKLDTTKPSALFRQEWRRFSRGRQTGGTDNLPQWWLTWARRILDPGHLRLTMGGRNSQRPPPEVGEGTIISLMEGEDRDPERSQWRPRAFSSSEGTGDDGRATRSSNETSSSSKETKRTKGPVRFTSTPNTALRPVARKCTPQPRDTNTPFQRVSDVSERQTNRGETQMGKADSTSASTSDSDNPGLDMSVPPSPKQRQRGMHRPIPETTRGNPGNKELTPHPPPSTDNTDVGREEETRLREFLPSPSGSGSDVTQASAPGRLKRTKTGTKGGKANPQSHQTKGCRPQGDFIPTRKEGERSDTHTPSTEEERGRVISTGSRTGSHTTVRQHSGRKSPNPPFEGAVETRLNHAPIRENGEQRVGGFSPSPTQPPLLNVEGERQTCPTEGTLPPAGPEGNSPNPRRVEHTVTGQTSGHGDIHPTAPIGTGKPPAEMQGNSAADEEEGMSPSHPTRRPQSPTRLDGERTKPHPDQTPNTAIGGVQRDDTAPTPLVEEGEGEGGQPSLLSPYPTTTEIGDSEAGPQSGRTEDPGEIIPTSHQGVRAATRELATNTQPKESEGQTPEPQPDTERPQSLRQVTDVPGGLQGQEGRQLRPLHPAILTDIASSMALRPADNGREEANDALTKESQNHSMGLSQALPSVETAIPTGNTQTLGNLDSDSPKGLTDRRDCEKAPNTGEKPKEVTPERERSKRHRRGRSLTPTRVQPQRGNRPQGPQPPPPSKPKKGGKGSQT